MAVTSKDNLTSVSPFCFYDEIADVLIRHGLFTMDEVDPDGRLTMYQVGIKYLFELERGYWFYCDYVPGPKLLLLEFMRVVSVLSPEALQACAAALNIKFTHGIEGMHDLAFVLYTTFLEYKQKIPLCGTYLLDRSLSKVILVMPWVGKSWQVPKGKIMFGETARECALREVREECGFDASQWMFDNAVDVPYKTGRENQCDVRMFFAVGVPENIEMIPQVVKEVRDVQWHALADIEATLKGYNRMKYASVAPMLTALKDWIRDYKNCKLHELVRPHGQTNPVVFPTAPLRPTFSAQPSVKDHNEDETSSPGSLTPAPSPLTTPLTTPGSSPEGCPKAVPTWPKIPAAPSVVPSLSALSFPCFKFDMSAFVVGL